MATIPPLAHRCHAQGTWDLSCTEHVQPFEPYAAAAARGLKEELGLPLGTVQPVHVAGPVLQELFFAHATDREFVDLYRALLPADVPVRIDAMEVVAWRWVEPAALQHEMREAPATFAPWVASSLAHVAAASGGQIVFSPTAL